MNLEYTKLTPLAKTPTRGTKDSIGLDIYSIGLDKIPGEFDSQNNFVMKPTRTLSIRLKTGIAFRIPKNHYLQLHLRSSSAFEPYTLANGTGVIDEDYLGECFVALRFRCEQDLCDFINSKEWRNKKIAQVILHKKQDYELVETPLEVFETYTSERGKNGYGSSGN